MEKLTHVRKSRLLRDGPFCIALPHLEITPFRELDAMSHSPFFGQIARAMRIGNLAERLKISTPEALERVAVHEDVYQRGRATRREFMGNLAKTAAAAGLAALTGPFAMSGTARALGSPSIGILGAGLAGLVCAEQLRAKGIIATIYEAEESRVGGRCWSMPNFLPGMAIEHGGQFIDNLHKEMLRRVPAGCALGDFGKLPGEVDYFIDGQHYHESVIVDAYRDFVAALRADQQGSSAEVSADSYTAYDENLDNTSLAAYVAGANGLGIAAEPLLQNAILCAYEGEYGLAASEQSALNFVQFIHADRRSKMAWFGVASDERWYVVGGNDQIAQGVAAGLPGQVRGGHRLTAVQRLSDGRIELTFANRVKAIHDAVVITLPFSVLRLAVSLHPNLGLSDAKRLAIGELGYGTNAKMAIGFNDTPWRRPSAHAAAGTDGFAYMSGLPNAQVAFPASPYESIEGPGGRAIEVDYSSGPRGAALRPSRPTEEAENFLTDFDRVTPGVKAAAMRNRHGKLTKVRLDHWPSNPNCLGSYTCYKTGQFTTIAGSEGKQEGNLHFAGEHTDSFYSWQGFMEGGCLSGIRAAHEILADIKAGRL